MSYALSIKEDTFLKDLAVASEEEIENVARSTLTMPQTEAGVVHRFGPGVYMRELQIPAGTFAIGRVHKEPHMNIVIKGKCVYYNKDGVKQEVSAPAMLTTPAGRKVGVFTEDTVWINVYATDSKDVEEIEATLFEDSEALEERKEESSSALERLLELERLDFAESCEFLGYTQDEVARMSAITEDNIPFPNGSYSVAVMPSKIHGKGLFATAPIKAKSIIAPARLDGMRTPAGRYTNHSALPNAEMIMESDGDVYLYALVDIGGNKGGLLGDEILIDYVEAHLDTRREG